jgi:uncharacterized membrane protein
VAKKKANAGLSYKYRGILLIIVCTLFTATGQILMKLGMRNFSIATLLFNIPLILGVFSYVLGAVLMLFAMKSADLSLIYPFIALSFIWVAIFSNIFLGELLIFGEWMGIALIIFGVVLIGRGAHHG